MSHEHAFILAASLDGLRIDHLDTGGLVRVPVDGDRTGKKSGAYRFFDDDCPTGIWWNWRTSAYGTWCAKRDGDMNERERQAHRDHIRAAQAEREAAQARVWQANAQRNAEIWGKAVPITRNDPTGRYLADRHLPIPDGDTIRHHPSLPYFDGGRAAGMYPVMLAKVQAPDGKMIGLHRTFLAPDGRKAAVPTAKKLMPASGRMTGAAIRLGEPIDRPDGLSLGVAEGIETALAVAANFELACWAAISAGGIRSFEWPSGIRQLFVMADNDLNGVGQAAGAQLAKRAAAGGLVARNIAAPSAGADWADVWAEKFKR